VMSSITRLISAFERVSTSQVTTRARTASQRSAATVISARAARRDGGEPLAGRQATRCHRIASRALPLPQLIDRYLGGFAVRSQSSPGWVSQP
jgi:hypothetical protein